MSNRSRSIETHSCRNVDWRTGNDILLTFELLVILVNIKGKKGKGSSLVIAPLTILVSDALQPRKWQLTGIDCSTAAGCPLSALTDFGPAVTPPAGILRPNQPSPRNPCIQLHRLLLIYRSLMDGGWVGHVGWPIADGLTIEWSPVQSQNRESSPAETSVLTTTVCYVASCHTLYVQVCKQVPIA